MNEHQMWIDNQASGQGGMDTYVAGQQAKYDQAVASGDKEMLGRLDADMQRVGYTLTPSQPALAEQSGGFDRGQSMQDMDGYLQQQSIGYLQNQQAQLQMNMESQIAQLKMSYEQAIADGQISIREAENQFHAQSKEIEKNAYLDAERTGMYAQGMGIQNSQQAIGLMQGDNARANSMKNQNVKDRDSRVADIRDRLNSIKQQKNLDITRVNAEYGAGLLGAQGEANMMYSQGMFGLMQDDYSANRNQAFAKENMAIQQGYQKDNMATEQIYAKEMTDINFANSLSEMAIKQGYTLEQMEAELGHQLQAMAVQNGYNVDMNSREYQQKLNLMAKEAKNIQDNYARDLQRALNGVTPGTQEYAVRIGEIELGARQAIEELVLGTTVEQKMIGLESDRALLAQGGSLKAPTDHSSKTVSLGGGGSSPIGGALNWITGYDKKDAKYKAEQEAIARAKQNLDSFGSDPYGYIKGNQSGGGGRDFSNMWED